MLEILFHSRDIVIDVFIGRSGQFTQFLTVLMRSETVPHLEDLVKIHRRGKPDFIGDLRDVPVGFKQDTGRFICSDIVDEF